MKWDELAKEPCSVARTVAVIGDRWTLMILRDCFLGVRRFEDFQTRLGISRTITTERLKALVDEGVLRKEAYQDRPVRFEYRLTQKGLDLYPVIMAVVAFGDRHYAGEAGPPLLHRHKACGCDFQPVLTCSECAEPVAAREVETRAGPGAVPGYPPK
ncbi:MAG: helix-turn-helix transcriptional regulator [Pseudomonadota bacterium]|nr:helix-turn-helix transcriptional regulator [Pseudomonadota bacterium]